MAQTLTSSIRVGLRARQVLATDLGTAESNPRLDYAKAFLSGVTAGKADRVFTDTRTLALSANEDLDLAGALTDPFGATLTFVKVKAIIITADAGNTNDVVVAQGSATPFNGPLGDASTISIPPGGIFVITAPTDGWAVGAGATDKLNVLNGGAGTPITYSIAVLGTSA